MKPIVATHQLTKIYSYRGDDVLAVNGVSFEVREGELFGLFGPNGAGKSTLIRMLSTLLQPTRGSATVNGFDITRDGLQVRRNVGLVASDERSFYGRLSARQNLWFFAALQNVSRSEIEKRIHSVLDLFGLHHKIDAPFQSLSTGQRQRLNMARALIHDPPILFLDEPTKSMDVQTSDFVKELIKHELVERQEKTVIFISHELYEMDNFCDRVAILAEGELQAIGTPEELGRRLPRRAIYRLQVQGDSEQIASRWQTLAGIAAVKEVSRGMSITSFDVTLTDETADAWLSVLRSVAECGGRVESYRRVDDGSLRDIIKFYSTKRRE